MLRPIGAALCGVAIIFACSVPTEAAVKAEHQVVVSKANSKKADPQLITGAASTYNPFRPGYGPGGKQTASGEDYDPAAWTAAIQTGLRKFFGGIFSGRAYRPAFALVEAANKRAVVKINDVGPLKPGRVIDFNEQTMKYFDPTMRRGLIHDVKVTPLHGQNWVPGPV
jgi:rare lipoprotein A